MSDELFLEADLCFLRRGRKSRRRSSQPGCLLLRGIFQRLFLTWQFRFERSLRGKLPRFQRKQCIDHTPLGTLQNDLFRFLSQIIGLVHLLELVELLLSVLKRVLRVAKRVLGGLLRPIFRHLQKIIQVRNGLFD